MKQTVYLNDFRDAFLRCRPDNFSFAALKALYDYFIDLEESTDEEMELDVIAICCEFSEYFSLEEFHKDYSAEDYPTIEDIEREATVIRIDDESFIVGEL